LFYWLLKRVVLGPLLRTLFRPWVKGLDHIPTSGGAILVSNHLSFSDSFFLPLVVPRRITFLAKADYFTGKGLKGRLTAGFFRSAGQVPVDRTGGKASEAALRTGLRVLGRGDLLGIYPEGTRSPDGRLYRGKTGVARMALEGHVPVLPVVMMGTDRVQPIGKRIPSIRQVGVIIGAPLDFSRYEGMESDRFVLRSITDEIMYELMRMSGQEYVDVYAATVKEQLAEAVRERIADVRARTERIAHNRPALAGLLPGGDERASEAGTVAELTDELTDEQDADGLLVDSDVEVDDSADTVQGNAGPVVAPGRDDPQAPADPAGQDHPATGNGTPAGTREPTPSGVQAHRPPAADPFTAGRGSSEHPPAHEVAAD